MNTFLGWNFKVVPLLALSQLKHQSVDPLSLRRHCLWRISHTQSPRHARTHSVSVYLATHLNWCCYSCLIAPPPSPPPSLSPPLSASLNTSASSCCPLLHLCRASILAELRRPLSVRLSAGDPEFSSNLTSQCSLALLSPLISLSSPSYSPLSVLLWPAFCSPFTSRGEDRGLGAGAAGGPDERLWSHGDLRKATDRLLALIFPSLQTWTCRHKEQGVYKTVSWVIFSEIQPLLLIRLFRFHVR